MINPLMQVAEWFLSIFEVLPYPVISFMTLVVFLFALSAIVGWFS